MESLLQNVKISDLGFMTLFFIVLFKILSFLKTDVWPFYRDVWLPAKIAARKLAIDHDYEVKKDNLAIMAGINNTLAKITIQIEFLIDLVKPDDKKDSVSGG